MPLNSPFAIARDARRRTGEAADKCTAPSLHSVSPLKSQPFSCFHIPSQASVQYLHSPPALTSPLESQCIEPFHTVANSSLSSSMTQPVYHTASASPVYSFNIHHSCFALSLSRPSPSSIAARTTLSHRVSKLLTPSPFWLPVTAEHHLSLWLSLFFLCHQLEVTIFPSLVNIAYRTI